MTAACLVTCIITCSCAEFRESLYIIACASLDTLTCSILFANVPIVSFVNIDSGKSRNRTMRFPIVTPSTTNGSGVHTSFAEHGDWVAFNIFDRNSKLHLITCII